MPLAVGSARSPSCSLGSYASAYATGGVPTVRQSQRIARPPEEVFAVIVRLDEYPTWNPTVKRAARISKGPIGEGSEFDFWIQGFGRTRQTLREFEPGRRLRLVPSSRMYVGGHRFELAPQGGGTRIDHTLDLEPRGLMRLMTPMLRKIMTKNLADTAAALQAYVERAK